METKMKNKYNYKLHHKNSLKRNESSCVQAEESEEEENRRSCRMLYMGYLYIQFESLHTN